MQDPNKKPGSPGDESEAGDTSAERIVVIVLAWIALVVLVPLHALVIVNVFFTSSSLGLVVLFLLLALPLAIADFMAYRWFRDNYSVFRWINRSGNGDSSRR